jgi:ankyrin repeat protein
MTTLQERRVSLHPQKLGAAGSNGPRQLCAEIILGNETIVEALLALGHDTNGTIEYKPLYYAVLMNHERIFQLLISYGADVHSPGVGAGRTLLQMLASRPRTSRSGAWIAEYLIRAGVPLETAHNESASAFVLAVENHYFNLADLLLSKGANINALYRPKCAKPRVTILSTLIAAQS